jgi:hypothetical protein
VALAAGDIKSGEVVVVVYDGTRFQVVSQLNSAGNATFANVSITSALNVGGVATFAAGTAAAPSITTTGDTNTGLFFPAADTIAFTEGGTESFRVNSSGQVGIGTASPAIRLQVSDVDQATARIGINNANGQNYQFVAGNPGASNTGFAIFDATASATRLYLDSSGNVGIGTSSPTEKLHVAGALRVTGAQTTAGTGVYLDQTSGTGGVSVYGPDNSTQGTFRIYTATANGGTGSTKLTLDSSGNLGLGITPSAWFSSFKAYQVGNQSLWSAAGGNGYLSNNAFFNTSSQYTYRVDGYATEYIQSVVNGSHSWHTAPSGTAGNAISFTQAMTLDANGNLVLGTTSALSSSYRITSYGGRVNFAGNNDALNLYLQYSNGTAGVFIGSPAANVLAFSDSNGTERARITSGGDLLVGTTSSGGTASNTTRVTGGIFSTFNATPSIANNTATTVATLPSGEGMYLVSASLLNSGGAADWNELALVRVSQSNTAVSTIVGAVNLDITVSGLNVQVTQRQGATQTIPVSIIRLL